MVLQVIFGYKMCQLLTKTLKISGFSVITGRVSIQKLLSNIVLSSANSQLSFEMPHMTLRSTSPLKRLGAAKALSCEIARECIKES